MILKNVRQVKELAGRVEQLEEELDTERQQRVRAEPPPSDLITEIIDSVSPNLCCTFSISTQNSFGS